MSDYTSHARLPRIALWLVAVADENDPNVWSHFHPAQHSTAHSTADWDESPKGTLIDHRYAWADAWHTFLKGFKRRKSRRGLRLGWWRRSGSEARYKGKLSGALLPPRTHTQTHSHTHTHINTHTHTALSGGRHAAKPLGRPLTAYHD